MTTTVERNIKYSNKHHTAPQHTLFKHSILERTDMISETSSCDRLIDMIENKVPSNTQFNISLININKLKEIISKLDPRKASGIEGVRPRVLKMLQVLLYLHYFRS